MARIQVAVTKEQTHRLNALVLVGVLLAFASVVHAERTNTSEERNFGMALPGEKCRILPLPKWTEPEKWAWTQICEGKEANFNERLKEKLDPRNPAHDGEWSDERKLSSIFLETILLHEPFRSAIPRQGVRIIGAYFPNFIDLTDASIERPLLLHKSRFRSQVDMNRLRTLASISLEGSKFDGDLNMDSASVGGGLFMRRAEFGEVVLRGVEIGDQLDMEWATFKGKLNMDAASVGSSLFMGKAELNKPANLIFLSVGSGLNARGVMLRGLDLTGARIEGELHLGLSDANIEWKSYTDENGDRQAPKLTLRNTSVGTLQDTKDTWPDHLEREFEGFTYDRLGGFGASEQDDPYKRESSWFIEWLAKDESYSPQPYRHLAGVFRAAGHEDMADDILVANRDRERRETDWWPPKWLWLWMLKLFIGYGYGLRSFYALYWIAGLTVFGTVLLCCAKESARDGTKLGFWYSLDMLLPVIRLREQHYTDVDLKTWAKYYFYFHKIMGYVLIFFVLAGLSGLTEE